MMHIHERCGGPPLKEPPANVHPALRRIWLEIKLRNLSAASVAKAAGYDAKTVRNWWQGKTTPSLWDVEAVLNALGCKLTVDP